MKNMNMLGRSCASVCAVCTGGSLVAAPVIREGSVTMEQSSDRMVTIGYTLDEDPAIITVDILTNDVSIGHANIQNIAGDVNVKTDVGNHTILWRPDLSWPGHVFTNDEVKVVVKAWATNAPPDYMVVDLTMNNAIFFYPNAEAIPHGGVTNDLYKTSMLVMRRIPAANVRWRMGSPTTEAGRHASSETCHYVTLTEDFYMGIYEVTQRQFIWMCGSTPSTSYNNPIGDTYPVCGYSVVELYAGGGNPASLYQWPTGEEPTFAMSYSLLGQLRTKTGLEFNLPTDAQWEYAYRAGCRAMYYNGVDEAKTEAELRNGFACVFGLGTTEKKFMVGCYPPNGYGLFDMAGNVWEWVRDRFNANASVPYPEGSAVIDPVGDPSSSQGTIRSGSWENPASDARAARREHFVIDDRYKTIGFRLVCPVVIR